LNQFSVPKPNPEPELPLTLGHRQIVRFWRDSWQAPRQFSSEWP
jgi:hypothetical protein